MTTQYLAGLFDGEGCVNIWIDKKGNHHLRITIASTYKPLVDQLKEECGGSIQTLTRKSGQNWKTGYIWKLNGRAAGEFLELIQPFLIIKQKQAMLGTAFRAMIEANKVSPGRELDPKARQVREMMSDLMHKYNKRGITN